MKQASNITSSTAHLGKINYRLHGCQEIKTERKTMYAPCLHSLLELQKEANKFYGFTSAETLKIAQSLYEKKLITYPRTESKTFTNSVCKAIASRFKQQRHYQTLSKSQHHILK